jgi:POT family proton-dependent oligopeptide transporter
VGGLYRTGDNRRADAFQIYYIFINAGVIISPLIVGTLGEKVGWAWGFDAAGVGMLIAIVIYLSGRKYLPADPFVARKKDESTTADTKPKLTRRDWLAIVALLILLPFLTIAIIPNNQIFNAYLVWAQDHVNLVLFGKPILTTWLITLDSIVSVSFLFLVVLFWRNWSKKFLEPTEINKIAIGSMIAVTGMLSLATGAMIAARTGSKVSIGWLLAFHVLNSAAFANIFPVSLALYARVAPPSLSGTIIGIYYVAFFAANFLVGIVGSFLEKMTAAHFWLLHAAFAGVAGIVFFLSGKLFGHLLAPSDTKNA